MEHVPNRSSPLSYLSSAFWLPFCLVQAKEEEEKGLSALEVITQHTRTIASTDASKERFCVFFDESRGIDCDVSVSFFFQIIVFLFFFCCDEQYS